jgi:hypothetical protein
LLASKSISKPFPSQPLLIDFGGPMTSYVNHKTSCIDLVWNRTDMRRIETSLCQQQALVPRDK